MNVLEEYRIARNNFKRARKTFAEYGLDVSIEHYNILDAVKQLSDGDKGALISDIVHIGCVDNSTVTRTANKLIEQGMLTKHIDTIDGRNKCLRITEKGIKCLERIKWH